MPAREVHVEQVIGKRVRDADGTIIGRIEELRVDFVDGEPAVTEFHVGPVAALERIGAFTTQLPFFSRLPFTKRQYRIGWQDMDLSDPSAPRTRRNRSDLRRVTEDASR